MRFSVAWAKTAAENVTLKVATVVLAVVVLAELTIIAGIAVKDPLIIERACFSRAIASKHASPNDEEIKSFLAEAIPLRFNSESVAKEGYLAIAEVQSRDKELAQLAQRQMSQKVITNKINILNGKIMVSADRLVSVGKIKSVLPLNLLIVLQETDRTEANSYGLIISSIEQVEVKEEKN